MEHLDGLALDLTLLTLAADQYKETVSHRGKPADNIVDAIRTSGRFKVTRLEFLQGHAIAIQNRYCREFHLPRRQPDGLA